MTKTAVAGGVPSRGWHSDSSVWFSAKRVISSSAPNGSSSSHSRGAVTSARASETRIFMPPESSRGTASAESSRPTARNAASTSLRSVGPRSPRNVSGNSTLRRTLAQGISAASWNT